MARFLCHRSLRYLYAPRNLSFVPLISLFPRSQIFDKKKGRYSHPQMQTQPFPNPFTPSSQTAYFKFRFLCLRRQYQTTPPTTHAATNRRLASCPISKRYSQLSPNAIPAPRMSAVHGREPKIV